MFCLSHSFYKCWKQDGKRRLLNRIGRVSFSTPRSFFAASSTPLVSYKTTKLGTSTTTLENLLVHKQPSAIHPDTQRRMHPKISYLYSFNRATWLVQTLRGFCGNRRSPQNTFGKQREPQHVTRKNDQNSGSFPFDQKERKLAKKRER